MGDLMGEEVMRDMTPRLIKDLGTRYPTEKSNYKKKYGLYECQHCNKEFESITQNVKRGFTKGCGCLIGKNITHGFSYHNFYTTWSSMLSRCNNPKSSGYYKYGARGITICEEWLDPKIFLDWCDLTHPNMEGYTLDRIDNDKGYSPDNCRWADASTQNINKRLSKRNKSGYVGVSWNKVRGMWTIRIKVNTKYVWLGDFEDLMEAVILRDNYIIENNLPHKLNLKQEKPNE